MNFFSEEKGQTALEYILLVAGAVLLVTITVILVRGQIIAPLTNTAANNASAIKNIIRNVS